MNKNEAREALIARPQKGHGHHGDHGLDPVAHRVHG